jgi:hypothetical protein
MAKEKVKDDIEVENSPNEFVFTKQRRVIAAYFSENVTKVVLNDRNCTVTSQYRWPPIKGKLKTKTAEYSSIDKVEIKNGFSLSSIISSIVVVIIGMATFVVGGFVVFLLIPFLLFTGFGSNVIITYKDNSKSIFMTGKLDGDKRQNLVAELDKKFSKG